MRPSQAADHDPALVSRVRSSLSAPVGHMSHCCTPSAGQDCVWSRSPLRFDWETRNHMKPGFGSLSTFCVNPAYSVYVLAFITYETFKQLQGGYKGGIIFFLLSFLISSGFRCIFVFCFLVSSCPPGERDRSKCA